MERKILIQWLDNTLNTTLFRDYAPNGLQVEGAQEVGKIMCAVTASRRAIEATIKARAQVLLVHHGMFWKNEPVSIVGWKKERIRLLLANNINLLAYHLPLDAQPLLGNNAQLARLMDWSIDGQFGEQNLIFSGSLNRPQTLDALAAQLQAVLKRTPMVIGDGRQNIKTVAWCSGGAQGFFQAAIDAGVDAFITGEVSEAQYHLAQETGVAFISAGHHATERYGVQALGQAISTEFALAVDFFDDENPA